MGLGTRRWIETEEWIRMDLAFNIGKEPIELPINEFLRYAHKFLKRVNTLHRLKYNRPIFSLPDIHFWYFIYLNLCDTQSLILTGLDDSNVLPWLDEQVACHALELKHMKDVNRREGYWGTEKWVYYTYGQNVTIQHAHKSVANGIWWDDYLSNPSFARKQRAAIIWNGDNFQSINRYFDNDVAMMRHEDNLTLINRDGSELVVYKDNWIWERDGLIKTGPYMAVVGEQAIYNDLGFWYEPTERPEWLVEQEEERRAV